MNQRHTLTTRNRDLAFVGAILGVGLAARADDSAGTRVRIYRTVGGTYVVHLHQWASSRTSDLYDARTTEDPTAVYDELCELGKGGLGRASRSAWEMAAEADPRLVRPVDTIA